MDLHEKIRLGALNMKGEAVSLLKKLVERDTTDYNEVNGQIALEEFLSDMDCEISRVYPDAEKLSVYPQFNAGHGYEGRYCVVARFPGTGEGRSLIMNAHMDTVFPASPDKWVTQPHTPVEKDDKIFGLGAADDKGGLCAMLMAISLLKRLGIRAKGDVIFESVVDEEAGGGNGTLAVIDAGFKADAALVAEPNRLKPASAQIGSYALRITVEGKSAHGNMKRLGVSAFEKAIGLINRLSELEKKWNARTFPLLDSPVLTILQIAAGDGSITLPATCEMLVNYTYFPDGYDYEGEIRDVIARYEAEDPWFSQHPIRVELHHNCGPYFTDPQSPWPMTVAECVTQVTGEPAPISGLPTGADSRLFANVGGMPCVVLGPGTILCAHNPNEYIEIDELVRAIAVYATIICKWCGI